MEKTITKITSSLYDQFMADFEIGSLSWPISETGELISIRQKAFEYFKKLGFPSTKNEDWKYTNLTPFLKDGFETQPDYEIFPIDDTVIAKAKIKSLDCYHIVLVNGRYRAELSDKIPGEGIEVLSLSAATNRPSFKKHFGQSIDLEKNHFAALNTALFTDGLFVEVKSKTVIDKPLHLIHISITGSNTFLQPRQLFVIGDNSELSIIESYITEPGGSVIFVNTVAEFIIGGNANVHHYCIQTGDEMSRYIHHTEVRQEASSVYNNYKASFPGTSLLRNNLNVVLDGENIESHLYGLYLVGGHQLIDNHTLVDHRKPRCQSNELYKGVMKDEAVGVFNGKIFVRKDAQKTNAFQQNNNLMLGKKAVVDSKPQLEIFADDVKCSHGSTIGQFNQDALFYLKSRGIGEENARALLIHAFVFDVTEKIPIPSVQAHINQLIEEGLKNVRRET